MLNIHELIERSTTVSKVLFRGIIVAEDVTGERPEIVSYRPLRTLPNLFAAASRGKDAELRAEVIRQASPFYYRYSRDTITARGKILPRIISST